MKKEKVWRYWCDFCKKGGCSGGHMRKHETFCTNNPARGCRMCAEAELQQAPIEALKEAARDGVDELRKVANGCPACMLAGARQAFDRAEWADEQPWVDYKAEAEKFWTRLNGERYEREAEAERHQHY